MAATAYRNKFPARCEVTNKMMDTGAGWVVPTKDGKWRALCDEEVEKAGFRKAGVDNTKVEKSGGRGLSTGLGVTDCWAKVFADNEARFGRGEKPLTDDDISKFMMSEFPFSPDDSRSVGRVRMYRSNYNRGAHSFAGRGEPKVKSHEYDAEGKQVTDRPMRAGGFGGQPGVSEARVREIAKEESALAVGAARKEERPVVHVSVGGSKAKKVDAAGKHAAFVDVLKRVEAGVPVLLVGPAGCGKTKLCEQVAEALGASFTFNSMSEGVSESHLLGRSMPDAKGVWRYEPAPFVVSYSKGGVHLLDEIDASDPNLLVSVNAAIANGFLSLPLAGAEPVRRHKESVIIAAANTYGNGADRQYVGRNQLDAATVDRFRMGTVEMDYDRALEKAIAASLLESEAARAELLNWAWQTRDSIRSAKLRRIMSTRNIIDSAKLLTVGVTMADVKKTFFLGWTQDEMLKMAGR